MSKKIIITLDTTGNKLVRKVDAVGFTGSECKKATVPYTDGMGVSTDKPELTQQVRNTRFQERD